jgi:probable rRNA maturation factor
MKRVRLPALFVHNRQRKIGADRAALEIFARASLALCVKKKGNRLTNIEEINVILISDRRMSQLHRQFMGIAGSTDVITFQHGEIFISVETARSQARVYGTSLERELGLYLVHGLLHLCGLDDSTPSGRRQMERAQERIVRRASV